MSPRKRSATPSIDPRAATLVAFPFPCPNCDSPAQDASLFCTELCRDEAKFVRYYRERIADGTLWKPDVREAIQIKRAHILNGGYNAQARQVPDAIRQSVIERDGGKCRSCSDAGSEIDHIKGDRSILENLELLCADCHRQKTMRNFDRISADEHPELWAKAAALDERAMADEPSRLCDHADWKGLWRSILSARRAVLRDEVPPEAQCSGSVDCVSIFFQNPLRHW
jgi:5-methylcytosine-specific restriction endonuclease McrA